MARTAWLPTALAGRRRNPLQQVLVPVVRKQIVARNDPARLRRRISGDRRRDHRILHRRRMIGLHGTAKAAAERRLVVVRRQRVEIVRQLRARRRDAEVRIRRLVERPARRRGRARADHRRTDRRTGSARTARPRQIRRPSHRRSGPVHVGLRGLVDQADFDFVGAETQPIAVAQRACRAAADRVGLGVQICSVCAGIRDLPAATAKRHGEMTFGQQPFRIGQHPVDVGSAADVEFSSGDRAGLRRDLVRAPQHGHRELHWRYPLA